MMSLTIRRPESHDKRKREVLEIQCSINYRDWNFEYQGTYNIISPPTQLTLTANATENEVDCDDEAVLMFGIVTDDQGFPFLRFNLSASEVAAGRDSLQSIEFIAKKTDTLGLHCLELTKNEKLRLGFPVRVDGTFEHDNAGGEKQESYESLTKQLDEHIKGQEKVVEQLAAFRDRVNEQLRAVGRLATKAQSLQSGVNGNGTHRHGTMEEEENEEVSPLVSPGTSKRMRGSTEGLPSRRITDLMDEEEEFANSGASVYGASKRPRITPPSSADVDGNGGMRGRGSQRRSLASGGEMGREG